MPIRRKSITSDNLTHNEKVAADHFLLHGNKRDAYLAGYPKAKKWKPESAIRNSVHLFNRPEVIAYIEKHRQIETDKAVLTRDEAIHILTDIARGKLSDYLDACGEIDRAKIAKAGYSLEAYEALDGGPDGSSRRKVKIRNPIQAIERVAKMLGWDAAEKLDLGGVTFNINTTGATP